MNLVDALNVFYCQTILVCILYFPISLAVEFAVKSIERDRRLKFEREEAAKSESINYAYDVFISVVLDVTHEDMIKRGVSDENYQAWRDYVNV